MIKRIKRLKNGQVQLLLTPRAEKAMKRCSSCGKQLPLDAYNRDRSMKDGHQNWCKRCFGKYRRSQQGLAARRRYDRGPKRRAMKRACAKARAANFRAAALKIPGRLSGTQLRGLSSLVSQCPYCSQALNGIGDVPWSNRCLDHIEPMSHGGRNVLENVLFCCPGCSQAKGCQPLTPKLLAFLRGKPCTEADVQAIYDNAARLAEQIKRNGKPTSSSDRKDSP